MNSVFNEIREIKIIKSDVYLDIPEPSVRINETLKVLSSKDYCYYGLNNELSKFIFDKNENKWYGKLKSKNSIFIKSSGMFIQRLNNYMFEALTEDIIGYKYHNGELLYSIENNPPDKICKMLVENQGLPRNKRNYIVNLKSCFCSCDLYKQTKSCFHAKELRVKEEKLIKRKLKMVFSQRLKQDITSDILLTFKYYA